MNIAVVASKVGIKDGTVVSKAEELLRLASIKLPGALGQVGVMQQWWGTGGV